MNRISSDNVRKRLDELIRKSDLDYTAMSLMLKRNKAYIQQFIKRGSPKVLAESDRKTLADYFDISEVELGAPQTGRIDAGDNAPYPIQIIPHVMDDEHMSIALSDNIAPVHCAQTSQMKHMLISDDAMAPTLSPGDVIIIDTAQTDVCRDGIYLWSRGGHAFVRRATFNPLGSTFIMSCDNMNRPETAPQDVHLSQTPPTGRVVWVSKRL